MRKILLIDDDSKTLMVVGAFLRQQGYESLTASDGKTGLTLARASAPDLVVCDLDMPGMHGFDVLAALRKEPGLEQVPVVFLTAHSSRLYQRQGMNLGADDFIGKPFELNELVAAIEARLRRQDEEQKLFQRRMDQAMQSFAGLVHDLRDPLFVICGYTRLLGAATPALPSSAASSQEIIGRLQHAAGRMQRIVGEVLHLARSRLDRLPFDPGRLDLRDFVEHLLRDHEQAYRLRLTCAPGDYRLMADVVRVRQALENLLSNALKYSDAPVKVRLAAQADTVAVEIQDAGIGIPPEEQAGLFEPFFRASNTGDRPGCGLGLCVARSCIEQHHGKLGCRSELGQGTTFTMELPRELPQPPGPAASGAEAADASTSDAATLPSHPAPDAGFRAPRAKLRAILVDDDPMVRSVMRDLLQDLGAVVVKGEAGSVAEARLLLAQQTPDLLFLDVRLPDGTGFDLLPSLRPATKVIFVTGAEEHAVHAFDCEALDYLLKPVSRERLEQALSRLQDRAANPPQPFPAPSAASEAAHLTGANPSFLIKTLRGDQLIPAQQIKTINAYGEYCWVHWDKQEKALLRKSLKQWLLELPGDQFVRIHRNAIVNLKCLLRVEHCTGGGLLVHLRDTPEALPVSQRLTPAFKRKLKHYANPTK